MMRAQWRVSGFHHSVAGATRPASGVAQFARAPPLSLLLVLIPHKAVLLTQISRTHLTSPNLNEVSDRKVESDAYKRTPPGASGPLAFFSNARKNSVFNDGADLSLWHLSLLKTVRIAGRSMWGTYHRGSPEIPSTRISPVSET